MSQISFNLKKMIIDVKHDNYSIKQALAMNDTMGDRERARVLALPNSKYGLHSKCHEHLLYLMMFAQIHDLNKDFCPWKHQRDERVWCRICSYACMLVFIYNCITCVTMLVTTFQIYVRLVYASVDLLLVPSFPFDLIFFSLNFFAHFFSHSSSSLSSK